MQATQAKLSALQGARREKAKKLDKLLLKQQSMKAVTNPDQALPSMALRGGGDAELVKEIENLLRENRELEDAIGQHDATRLHLEKLQNEKKDVVRKVKELKGEEKVMIEQLEIKKAELQELQEQVKHPRPSARATKPTLRVSARRSAATRRRARRPNARLRCTRSGCCGCVRCSVGFSRLKGSSRRISFRWRTTSSPCVSQTTLSVSQRRCATLSGR